MKILNKILEWFFDRETDKEEDWEVPFSNGGDMNHCYNKFMMQVNEDNLNHSRETHKFNKSIDDFEGFEVSDCNIKIKYYKRKVKIFHGLQGFKWEYAYNFAEYGAVMRSCGYIEITKEEYEANVK